MSETIISIEEFQQGRKDYGTEAGFKIKTDEQEIILVIEDDQSCCESWGYFLSEDNTSKFVGAVLQGVAITDTNRTTKTFPTGWDGPENDNHIHLDDGDTMFVDIETDQGVLQFVAYNAHNGYYGHAARVESKQLTHTEVL